MQQAQAAMVLLVLRSLGGAVLFRSSRPSPNHGYPFWLLVLTFRSSRPAFCGRLTSPVSAMKHTCPACGQQLKGKLLLTKGFSGNRLLSNQATLVCPFCSERISHNMHWSEIVLGCFVIVLFLSFKALPWWLVVACCCAIGISWGLFHYFFLKHHLRYKLYSNKVL